MNKKQLIALLIIGIFLLSGCARVLVLRDLNSAYIYIGHYSGYPLKKELGFGNKKSIDAKETDTKIEEYLNKHPNIEKNIAKQMRIYKVCKGMTKEQVLIIAHPDVIKSDKKNNQEIWIYGSVINYGNMVKIIFKNDIVTYIDWKFWDYTWPDYTSKEEYIKGLDLK